MTDTIIESDRLVILRVVVAVPADDFGRRTLKRLQDEVQSNLESCDENVLHVGAELLMAPEALKREADHDGPTFELARLIAEGKTLIKPTPGILKAIIAEHDHWCQQWAEAVRAVSAWSADDEQGFDALIELVHTLGLVSDSERARVDARRLQPGEDGYHEPVNALELRRELTDWMVAGVDAAAEVAGSELNAMIAMTKQHEKLLAILGKHNLLTLTPA